ncbi:hypothetical protein R3P38DRAFT_3366847 [Favolaschia claudopus]|uniref:Secreted protein CSS2 C-terminal domain-containing protein n=1 Tax=Favolaschia claudopus TaxID=2862362 RepID=A0AAW0ABE4_9AGAR
MCATTYSITALAILSGFWSPVSGVAVGQDSTSGAFGGKQQAHTLVYMDITDGGADRGTCHWLPDLQLDRHGGEEEYGLLHSYCSPKRQRHCDRRRLGNHRSDSNNGDCTVHTGSVDDVSWEVYATGQNCDTTAELKDYRGCHRRLLARRGQGGVRRALHPPHPWRHIFWVCNIGGAGIQPGHLLLWLGLHLRAVRQWRRE